MNSIRPLILLCAFLLLVPMPVLAGSWLESATTKLNDTIKKQSLSTEEIGGALKEALDQGTSTVVTKLSAPDGFNKDKAIRIPLPDNLKKVRKALKKIGQEKMADKLEVSLNRAAELATTKAKPIFLAAIKEMTFADAREIYEGPDDSATRYFKGKTSKPLQDEMRPIVQESLAKVDAIKLYNSMIKKYKSIPFVPDVEADLTDHVLKKGTDGIFHYVAEEEANIRRDPAKQTTNLLKKVFGNKK